MKRILLAALLCLGASAQAQEATLKIATLAPEGSSWMNLFHAWGKTVEEHSGGKIKVKFYAGGVAGDERDAVRKMRLRPTNGGGGPPHGPGPIPPPGRGLQ